MPAFSQQKRKPGRRPRGLHALGCALVTALASLMPGWSQVVVFPDAALESAVRAALGQPSGEVTVDDMQRLTSLDASYRGIERLDGLGAAHNLGSLNLSYNRLGGDLTLPTGLSNLILLSLDGNQLSNLVCPADLSQLVVLHLNENSLSDLSFLNVLPNLVELHLEYNNLSTLNLPDSRTNLQALDLAYNLLTNLTLPAGLTALHSLALDDNGLTTIDWPGDLTNLTELTLGLNRLTNFTFLSQLPSLRWLDVSANRLTQWVFPPGLSNLWWVNLGENRLREVTLSCGLPSLRSLFLLDNQLDQITLPDSFGNLRVLDLSVNRLTEVTLPPSATNVVTLELRQNPLERVILPEVPDSTNLTQTIQMLRAQGVAVFLYPLAVRLSVPEAWQQGLLRFAISGPPSTYALLESVDLTNWASLGILTNRTGSMLFTNVNTARSRQSFYQAVSPLSTCEH